MAKGTQSLRSMLLLLCGWGVGTNAFGAAVSGPWTADMAAIRAVAAMIPGSRPERINVAKVAESRRTRNFAVKGAKPEPGVQARTAYQIVFRDGAIMIDSGMDLATHRYFGRGTEEPYFADVAKATDAALLRARAIVLTHEHGDHVGGVLTSAHSAELARKTLLTREQMLTLMTNPQMPSIGLSAEAASRFLVFDYERYYPLAPGIALIRTPGHTSGSQMIYVVLQSGREYLFAGDVAWHMDGVRMTKGKDAPWIDEPEGLMLAELTWLQQLNKAEANIHIVVSHDEDQRLEYIRAGLLGGALE